MLRLAAQMLRRRIGSALATLLALTVGVMILATTGALVESGLRYQPTPDQYAAADVVVAHPEQTFVTTLESGDEERQTLELPDGGTVPASLADKIRAVPGVVTVAVDHRVAVVASAPATGHGWSVAALTPYRIIKGDRPSGPGDVVLDARVAGGAEPGARTQLLVAGIRREYRVTGVAEGSGPPSVFFTDNQAALLSAKPDRAAAIGVVAAPQADVEDVEAAVGGLADAVGVQSYAGSDRGRAEQEPGSAQDLLIGVGNSFGGYVVLLVGFVVAGTIGLSVRHRRRELALLRAIAATPGQVRRMIVAEAALLSLAGAAIGIPASLLTTGWVHGQFVERGLVPASFPMVTLGPSALLTAAIVALVAMLAALSAGRRTVRIHPAEALGEAAVEPARTGKLRLTFGLMTLGGAGAVISLTAGAGAEAAMAGAVGMLFLFIIAVSLLAPWINRASAWLLSPVLRALWGPSGYLAAKNLKANAQAMSTVLTALVLSVGFGGSVWFLQDNLQRATVSQTRDGTLAQRVLLSPAGLPDGAAAEIRRIPGVRAATGVRRTSVIVKNPDIFEPIAAQAIDPDNAAATLNLRVTSGRLADLGVDTVAVSRTQAAGSGWKLGRKAELFLGDGTPVTLRVVAVYERGLGFGDVILPRQVVTGHTATNLDDQILIRTEPGADAEKSLTSLAARYPGSTVIDSADLHRQLATDLALNSWLNKLFVAVLVGYAVLAAANTMVMAALSRRRELSLLRLVGVTGRQIKRMILAEQAGLLGVALIIGGGVAATTLITFVRALTGNPVPYVPVWGWLAVLGGTTLLTLTTTILPIGRLLRVPPVHSIGVKE
uniref:FtsX-like permease family protein n=1 Tax=Paractinoplanes polyasparticus TaxID=2856853 RepID=UPI001C840E9D|nr:FtsX-like permease family protein [Actinoplanes polyasparticus]